VHGLLHLCDDVVSQNCSLNEISAFPFENYLQSIKKMVRNSRNPVVQVSNRLTELMSTNLISKIKKIEFKLSTKPKDSCFFNGSKIMFVKQIKANGDYLCDGIKLRRLENLFLKPVPSKTFNIAFLKKGTKLTEELVKRRDVQFKCVSLPYKEGKAIIPLLHDCNEK